MSTPQEKALELCQRFGQTTFMDKECNEGMTLPLHIAKKCAFITVSEILDATEGIGGSYWNKVLKEIEIL